MKNQLLQSVFILMTMLSISGCSSDDSVTTPTCSPGYMGTNCDVKITPSKIKINKVVIRSFPLVDENSNNWDGAWEGTGPNPDIFFILSNGVQALYVSPYYEDAVLGNNQTYILSPPIEITSVLTPYIFAIFDYDGGDIENSEAMGGGNFYIYEAGAQGFPEVRTISGENLIVDFHLSYEW